MNKKGYLLSEVIISFSLSFIILIVIFNTTMDLNQKLNSLYIKNKAVSQQIMFNRKIADDFFEKSISSMDYDELSNTCAINYSDSSQNYLTITSSYINFSKNSAVDPGEKIYLSDNTKIDLNNIACEISSDGIAKLIIPIKHSKLHKHYGIELYNVSSSFIY